MAKNSSETDVSENENVSETFLKLEMQMSNIYAVLRENVSRFRRKVGTRKVYTCTGDTLAR